jgi:Pvc16 N-terminal domain
VSGPLAVATVTSALQQLLTAALRTVPGGADVSARAPDRAREAPFGAKSQVNVFLYHTTLDAAWRNQDPPDVKPGESGFPPLPLVLHYLVSAYGQGDDEIKAQTVLGHALGVLHDHPVLGRDEFEGLLPGSDLHTQLERIRITPQPLTVDELTKLWTAFQTNARLSACYEVSVVLISSARTARTPLPVLRRGERDSGADAQAGTVPPFPTVERVRPPNGEPAAVAGELIALTGHHLAGATGVLFVHPLATAGPRPPTAVTDSEITVTVPTGFPAGTCTVAVIFPATGGPEPMSNAQPLAIAPRITGGVPAVVQRAPNGSVTVNLQCAPAVRREQQALLLLGEEHPRPRSPRPPPPPPAPPGRETDLRFVVPDVEPGEYLVRLRVDGVDSRLVDRRVVPPVFDRSQQVTVT